MAAAISSEKKMQHRASFPFTPSILTFSVPQARNHVSTSNRYTDHLRALSEWREPRRVTAA
jgi:hypothetical protein